MLKKGIFYMLLFCIYLLLPFLILIDIISFDFKFYALTIGGIIVFLLMKWYGYKNEDMGISKKNIFFSIKDVFPLTCILFICGILLFVFGKSQRFNINEDGLFFLFYIFISCPLQEFLYRGALNSIFNSFKFSSITTIFISSLLYSYVHIIYHDFLTLFLTFSIGIIWHYLYRKTNNLCGVVFSHIVLGVVTILIGLIN